MRVACLGRDSVGNVGRHSWDVGGWGGYSHSYLRRMCVIPADLSEACSCFWHVDRKLFLTLNCACRMSKTFVRIEKEANWICTVARTVFWSKKPSTNRCRDQSLKWFLLLICTKTKEYQSFHFRSWIWITPTYISNVVISKPHATQRNAHNLCKKGIYWNFTQREEEYGGEKIRCRKNHACDTVPFFAGSDCSQSASHEKMPSERVLPVHENIKTIFPSA